MIRRPSMRRWLISTTALAGVLALGAPAALANPEGGVVTQGSATITQPDAKTVQVNQTSNRAVIDWRSFSIAADELTRFNQPSSSAIALNRVTGDQVSQILGRLQANGQIVLVNPNGIVFGADSKIDVGALIASTANIKTENFMAGNLKFDIPGKPNAQIINHGTITAADGGLVAIVSPYLRNSGIIVARLGKVGLAAANGATLDLYGDNLILFQASDKITNQLVGLDGKLVTGLIENDGKIYADGGRVLLTANVAKGVVDNAINTTGLISARAVEQQGGEIVLKGEDAGIVQVSGTLDASGKETGQKGGTVNVLGEKVGLVGNASVDVSGDTGGGTALIGGDYQGKGTVRNAQVTYMGKDATINANALRIGNGGRVILWADGTTRSYGRIFAQGGANGGDGGFVETSGKGFLDQTGTVNTLATKGKTGTWLLDPMDIFVANNGAQTLDGTNSSLFADNSGGTSIIAPSVINSATSNVTLQASRDAYVINAINMTNAGKALIIEAGRNLRVNANINTNDGDIFLLGGYDSATGQGGMNQGATVINGASVYSGAGNITIAGRGASSALTWNNEQHGIVVVNGGSVSSTSGNITMRGTGGSGSGSIGIIVGDQGSVVTSADGDIDIIGVSGTCPGCYVGQGGVQVGGAGSEGQGIAGGLIGITGSGGLRIQGSGYNATWSTGVGVVDGGSIRHTGTPAAGKKFEIIGNSATGDHSSWAVRVANSGYILTKDADLTIWGTAGNAAWLDSVGISVADYGANGMPHITSTGQGAITLIGTPGTSAGSLRTGVSIGQDTWTNWNHGGRQAYIQTAGAPVTFQTDSLVFRSVPGFGFYVVGPGGVNTPTTSTVTQVAYGTPASPSTARTVSMPPAPGANSGTSGGSGTYETTNQLSYLSHLSADNAIAKLDAYLEEQKVQEGVSVAVSRIHAGLIKSLDNDVLKKFYGEAFASKMRGGFYASIAKLARPSSLATLKGAGQDIVAERISALMKEELGLDDKANIVDAELGFAVDAVVTATKDAYFAKSVSPAAFALAFSYAFTADMAAASLNKTFEAMKAKSELDAQERVTYAGVISLTEMGNNMDIAANSIHNSGIDILSVSSVELAVLTDIAAKKEEFLRSQSADVKSWAADRLAEYGDIDHDVSLKLIDISISIKQQINAGGKLDRLSEETIAKINQEAPYGRRRDVLINLVKSFVGTNVVYLPS